MALVPYGNSEVSQDAVASALFYLLAYAITTFGAWAVVIALEKSEGRGLALSDYAGLARKYPALAAAMTVFMLSLTGVPPTLGFVSKFYLFRTVIEGGYIGLAVIGGLTSLVSAYYYLPRGGHHVHVGRSAGDPPRALDHHHCFQCRDRDGVADDLLDPPVSVGIPGDHAGFLIGKVW